MNDLHVLYQQLIFKKYNFMLLVWKIILFRMQNHLKPGSNGSEL